MEIRTGRQAMTVRVIQMESKTDKISDQMQELMNSTSKIIAKLGDPEETEPPTVHKTAEDKQNRDNENKFLTDRDLKKFRKKVENVLDDAFHSFGTEIAAKLTRIEERINSRLNDLVEVQSSQEDSGTSDVKMEDDD